jgi:hypothetical protein
MWSVYIEALVDRIPFTGVLFFQPAKKVLEQASRPHARQFEPPLEADLWSLISIKRTTIYLPIA